MARTYSIGDPVIDLQLNVFWKIRKRDATPDRVRYQRVRLDGNGQYQSEWFNADEIGPAPPPAEPSIST